MALIFRYRSKCDYVNFRPHFKWVGAYSHHRLHCGIHMALLVTVPPWQQAPTQWSHVVNRALSTWDNMQYFGYALHHVRERSSKNKPVKILSLWQRKMNERGLSHCMTNWRALGDFIPPLIKLSIMHKLYHCGNTWLMAAGVPGKTIAKSK